MFKRDINREFQDLTELFHEKRVNNKKKLASQEKSVNLGYISVDQGAN